MGGREVGPGVVLGATPGVCAEVEEGGSFRDGEGAEEVIDKLEQAVAEAAKLSGDQVVASFLSYRARRLP